LRKTCLPAFLGLLGATSRWFAASAASLDHLFVRLTCAGKGYRLRQGAQIIYVAAMPKKKEPPLSAEEQRKRFEEMRRQVGAQGASPTKVRETIVRVLPRAKKPPKRP
jgi:hypothetical protein